LNEGKDVSWETLIIDYILLLLEEQKKKTKKNNNSTSITDELEKAKLVLIPSLLEFNKAGFARCLWHNDADPSLHYIKESNRVYCFGCNKSGDVIDVYQELNECSMKEAIKALIK